MTEYKIYVRIIPSLPGIGPGGPVLSWQVGKDGWYSTLPDSRAGGAYSLTTETTLDECMKQMVEEIYSRLGSEDIVTFVYGFPPYSDRKEAKEEWAKLEEQGFPRYAKEQIDVVLGLTKKYAASLKKSS